jgi:hypothetical protein
MGEVYKSRDTRIDRIVALKVSGAQFSALPKLRFMRRLVKTWNL